MKAFDNHRFFISFTREYKILNMKRLVLVQLLLFFTFTCLYPQKKFWEIAGKLPILEQGVSKNMVLQGFNWVEVKDSFFVTVTDVAVNSKSVMLGRVNKDLSRGLFKSVDGGKKWEKIVPKVPLLSDPQLRKGLFATEQEYQKLLDRSRYFIQDLFAFGQDFYMVNGDGQFAGTFLLRSKDMGKTWEKMSTLSVYSSIRPNVNSLIKTENYADMRNSTFMGSNALYLSSSQDSGRTWKQEFEGRSNVGYIYTGQNFSIDSKYSTVFLKYESEAVWYNKEMFENRERQPGELHMADIRKIYRGSEKGPLFSIIRPEKRFTPNSFGTPVGEEHFCQSTDGGNTWKVVSKIDPGSYGGIHFIDCNNVIYASLESPVEGFCRSTDGGKTWEPLTGLPVTPILGTVFLSSNGFFYYVDKKQLYKSVEKACNSAEPAQNSKTTGVTIITHDFQLIGNAPIFKPDDWAFQMASEVLKVAQNGTIFRYNKITGDYEEVITLGNGKKGEKILLFDWASESSNTAPGYSEAAADALFNSLIIGNKKGIFDLKNIHFIGHGRGSVVNTLAVERLLVLQNNYDQYKNQILIDQVTNISPHDWGIAIPFKDIQGFDLNTIAEKSIIDKHYMLWCSDINDAHPDIKIEEPVDYSPNNGVIAWKGIFNDTYFQENGKFIEKKDWEKKISYFDMRSLLKSKSIFEGIYNGIKAFVGYNYNIEVLNLNDRRLAGSHYILWNDNEKGQYTQHFGEKGLYHIYTKTISQIPSHKGGGYQFSHLGRDRDKRPKDGYGSSMPTFNFYNNITVSNVPWKDRIIGICNGSFDRETDNPDIGSSGWSYHGGYFENGINRVYFTDERASLFNDGGIKATKLVHNRMYIPLDAQSISFLIRTNKVIEGELLVSVTDIISGKKNEKTILFKKDIKDFMGESIDITSLRDKVVTLSFSFKSKIISTDIVLPSLDIDDVKLTNKSIGNIIVVGYVQTKQGSNLRLRAEPSEQSAILTQIPNGSKVHILEEDDKETIVNGEKGRWLEIEFNQQIGWVWGPFIKRN